MLLESSDYLRGQQKVRLYAIAMVLFEAVLYFEMWTAGREWTTATTVRMAVTAVLMWWMSRGSNVARWIVVVTVGAGTAIVAVMMAVKQLFVPEIVTQLIAQGYFVGKLVRDQQVRTFFRGLSIEPSAPGESPVVDAS